MCDACKELGNGTPEEIAAKVNHLATAEMNRERDWVREAAQKLNETVGDIEEGSPVLVTAWSMAAKTLIDGKDPVVVASMLAAAIIELALTQQRITT